MYNIICDSLGITPSPNNGTLRLPFKPVGLHSDADAPKLDTPADPVVSAPPKKLPTATPEAVTGAVTVTTTPPSPGAATNSIELHRPPPVPTTTLSPSTNPAADQAIQDAETAAEDAKKTLQKWWDWVLDKFHEAEDWAKGVVQGEEEKKSSPPGA